MRESCTSGSVRGVLSNEHPYRDRALPISPGVTKPRAPCPRARYLHGRPHGQIASDLAFGEAGEGDLPTLRSLGRKALTACPVRP